MSVAFVIVSHSDKLAEGVVDLAGQMARDVQLRAAGGTDDGRIVELQGTGERTSFDRDQLDRLLDMGQAGIARLVALQDEVTGFRS